MLNEKNQGAPVFLPSQYGSPMKAATFQVLLEKLGIQSSFSRPAVSNDNPYSEAIFRTLKYRPGFPDAGFETLDDALTWTAKFVHWHTHDHQHSGINFVTPEQRHTGVYIDVLKKRNEVYERAKQKHPERCAGPTRNWDPIESVALNPMKEERLKRSE